MLDKLLPSGVFITQSPSVLFLQILLPWRPRFEPFIKTGFYGEKVQPPLFLPEVSAGTKKSVDKARQLLQPVATSSGYLS